MRIKSNKRLLSAFLLTVVVISMVFSCFSCSHNREYDEQIVLEAARNLVKSSELVNEIFYGYGIRYSNDLSQSNGSYYRADYISLSEYGVETLEDIKALTRSTYTVKMSNLIFDTKLSSVSDEDGIQSYSRYYQKYSAADESVPECIMVYKDAEVYLVDDITYDYDTLSVSRVDGESIFLTLTVTVTNDKGQSQRSSIEIELIEEADGFRLNSPTYKRYVDEDYYNELQNKK